MGITTSKIDVVDSSEDERDDFLREMIANDLMSENKKGLDIFDKEKLKYTNFKKKLENLKKK